MMIRFWHRINRQNKTINHMDAKTTPTTKQKLTRAIWLAFQASSPMGMGFLHTGTANGLKEPQMEELIDTRDDGSMQAYTDYVAGRMMKTDFAADKDGKITIRPEEPRHDYQSWGGVYANATEMLKAVDASFES